MHIYLGSHTEIVLLWLYTAAYYYKMCDARRANEKKKLKQTSFSLYNLQNILIIHLWKTFKCCRMWWQTLFIIAQQSPYGPPEMYDATMF